jgi:hypothetical protein
MVSAYHKEAPPAAAHRGTGFSANQGKISINAVCNNRIIPYNGIYRAKIAYILP